MWHAFRNAFVIMTVRFQTSSLIEDLEILTFVLGEELASITRTHQDLTTVKQAVYITRTVG